MGGVGQMITEMMTGIVPETAKEIVRVLQNYCGSLPHHNLGLRQRQTLYRSIYNQMFIAVNEIEETRK